MPTRHILMVSSEAVPFAKTGGLGDVAGALPQALARLGHRVTLVLPRYRNVPGGDVVARAPITLAGGTREAAFVEHPLGEVARAVLVECPELYDRPQLYGVGNNDYPDNAVRFAFLSRAALEFMGRTGERPDVVHAHDWQGGLVPVYLRTVYATHPALGGTAAVFTIHNLAYQGLFAPHWMPALDLGWDLYGLEGLEFWGRVSFVKGGINFSDVITTVSARYAKEVQTPEFGFGFEGILRRRADRLVGILNGIDADTWDPGKDPHLPQPFGPDALEGKRAAKQALLEAVGLPVSPATMDRPLVGMVSRLVSQKGLDLLAALSERIPSLDATWVLLGSGEAQYEDMWQGLALAHPDRIAARFGFDDRLAHLLEGGADIFLMPSRFEPCGLNQMYSLRYGTVPVVRATGGLDDTIVNWNPRTGRGTGFKFSDATPESLWTALGKALAAYGRPEEWRTLQRAGMLRDHSWDVSAREYVKVYEKAIRLAKRAGVPAAGPSPMG